MAAPDKIYGFNCQPGIQRDGTTFSSQNYIDGMWCRFYRGLPRKIGGYSQITDLIENIPRGIFVLPDVPYFDVYIGDAYHLVFMKIDATGVPSSGLIDRTPAFFPASPDNLWSFDLMFFKEDEGSILVAHAAPNLSSIDSTDETKVWYGEVGASTKLLPTPFSTSGGIVVLSPFLVIFGNGGLVIWSDENDPTTELGSARVTGSKIVAGMTTRGGNSSPAGLLWSLDSVIRMTQVGTTTIEFAFDTVTANSSILSSKCIVEQDGQYYWPGINRFFMYGGTVQELPNNMSLDYFYANINLSQREKVWGTKVSRWGEIWWHFPTLESTECNHALIYNYREKTWYDTPITRSSGYFEQTFGFPIWSGNVANEYLYDVTWSNFSGNKWNALTDFYWPDWPAEQESFSIWRHEVGVDKNINGTLTAIESHFESGAIANVAYDITGQRPNMDRWVSLYRVEPDLVQVGPMFLIVNGREYARSAVTSSTQTWLQWTVPWSEISQSEVPEWFSWGDYVFTPTTTKIDMREQRREMTLKMHSKALGGYYELGQTLLVARIGDGRQ